MRLGRRGGLYRWGTSASPAAVAAAILLVLMQGARAALNVQPNVGSRPVFSLRENLIFLEPDVLSEPDIVAPSCHIYTGVRCPYLQRNRVSLTRVPYPFAESLGAVGGFLPFNDRIVFTDELRVSWALPRHVAPPPRRDQRTEDDWEQLRHPNPYRRSSRRQPRLSRDRREVGFVHLPQVVELMDLDGSRRFPTSSEFSRFDPKVPLPVFSVEANVGELRLNVAAHEQFMNSWTLTEAGEVEQDIEFLRDAAATREEWQMERDRWYHHKTKGSQYMSNPAVLKSAQILHKRTAEKLQRDGTLDKPKKGTSEAGGGGPAGRRRKSAIPFPAGILRRVARSLEQMWTMWEQVSQPEDAAQAGRLKDTPSIRLDIEELPNGQPKKEMPANTSRRVIQFLRWGGMTLPLDMRELPAGAKGVPLFFSGRHLKRYGISTLFRGHWRSSLAAVASPGLSRSRRCAELTSLVGEVWFSRPLLVSRLWVALQTEEIQSALADVVVEGIVLPNPPPTDLPPEPRTTEEFWKAAHRGHPQLFGFEDISVTGWRSLLRTNTEGIGVTQWIDVEKYADTPLVARLHGIRFRFDSSYSAPVHMGTFSRESRVPGGGFNTVVMQEENDASFLPFSAFTKYGQIIPKVCFGGLLAHIPQVQHSVDWEEMLFAHEDVLQLQRSVERSKQITDLLQQHSLGVDGDISTADSFDILPSSLPAVVAKVNDGLPAPHRTLSSILYTVETLEPTPDLKQRIVTDAVPRDTTAMDDPLQLSQIVSHRQSEHSRMLEDSLLLQKHYPRMMTKSDPVFSSQFHFYSPHSSYFPLPRRDSDGYVVNHDRRYLAEQISFTATYVALEAPVFALEDLRRSNQAFARTVNKYTLISNQEFKVRSKPQARLWRSKLRDAFSSRIVPGGGSDAVKVIMKRFAEILNTAALDAIEKVSKILENDNTLSDLSPEGLQTKLSELLSSAVVNEMTTSLASQHELQAEVENSGVAFSALDKIKLQTKMAVYAQYNANEAPIGFRLDFDFADMVEKTLFEARDDQSEGRSNRERSIGSEIAKRANDGTPIAESSQHGFSSSLLTVRQAAIPAVVPPKEAANDVRKKEDGIEDRMRALQQEIVNALATVDEKDAVHAKTSSDTLLDSEMLTEILDFFASDSRVAEALQNVHAELSKHKVDETKALPPSSTKDGETGSVDARVQSGKAAEHDEGEGPGQAEAEDES